MTPETCPHPLTRIVWRDGEGVWCWACRIEDDRPRLLPEPEAWMVIQRWRALGLDRGLTELLRETRAR